MAAQTLAVGQWDRRWVLEDKKTLEFDTQEFECGCWVLGAGSQLERQEPSQEEAAVGRQV